MRERRMPAKMPGRRPVIMAVTGKRSQVAGRAVGVMLTGESVVEVSVGEVESAGSVDVDVDDASDEDDGDSSFWFRSLMQSAVLPVPTHEKPKGQQRSVPHCDSSPVRFVVLMGDWGWSVAFCWDMLQTIGLMPLQGSPAGQQRRVVLEARVTQLVPLGQQKSEGNPEPEQKS